MTAAVDRLEQSGYVERGLASTDRRARIVRLTKAGTKLIQSVFAEHERDMERVFSRLGKQERNALANLLRKLGHKAADMIAEEKKLSGKSNKGETPCRKENKYWVFMEQHRRIGLEMAFPCGQSFPLRASRN